MELGMHHVYLALNILSPIFGLFGSFFIFRFGIPYKVDAGGSIVIVIEKSDESEKKKIKQYKWLSYLGVSLLFLSFSCQLIEVLLQSL
jgi:hypothetical protein